MQFKRGRISGGSLCSSRQQPVWITVQTFPEPLCLERVCRQSVGLTCFCNRAELWFLSDIFCGGIESFQPGKYSSEVQCQKTLFRCCSLLRSLRRTRKSISSSSTSSKSFRRVTGSSESTPISRNSNLLSFIW